METNTTAVRGNLIHAETALHLAECQFRTEQARAGAALRYVREASEISLRQLAKELGLSAMYVSDLERGKRNWSVERFDAYIEALKTLSNA